MQLRAVFVVIALVTASVAVGTAAFTSGSVDRTANVDVVGDGSAAIGLSPGSSSVVYYDGNNEMQIDFGNMSTASDGVNANASYTIGNPNDANNNSAFSITNNDDTAHDFTLSYAFSGTAGSGDVTFAVYNSTGTKLTEATSSTNSTAQTLSAGETVYIVITADSSGADSSNDLSGTLRIEAT